MSILSGPKRCSSVPVANEISKPDVEYMDITKLRCPVKGMRLAVIPFLSNYGKTTSLVRYCTGEPVGFDVVLRKHLLICCVSSPLANSKEVRYFQAMMDAYSDLPRDKFEMVLVASSDSTKPAFHYIFSELSCLAIPFSDSDTRHFICSFICGLNSSSQRPQLPAILVDPEEIVLQYLKTPYKFVIYGSEWFPFRDTDIEAIRIKDMVLLSRLDPLYKKGLQGVAPQAVMRDPLINEPLSLYRDILLCEPSLAIPRIGSFGGADESVTVLELSKKHVGLYLCLEQGSGCLQDLISLHQECIEKNLELEILVVCIPLLDPTNSFPEKLIEDLWRRNITSWLVFPKHNKIWRRLWRVFSLELFEDRLIILPPDGKPGELEGRGVIEQLGITAYPFTRSTLLERRFNALRSLTSDSLFKGTCINRTCLTRKGKKLNARQSSLESKKLLVYLDWLQLSNDYGKLCCRLLRLYPKIKARGWEVVFVPLDHKHRRPHALYARMPWPIMPVQETCETCVPHKLIFEGEANYGNQVIAFRKDGKIVSREVMKDLMKNKLSGSLFRDNLYEEIAVNLSCFSG
ncbi:putative nucleoredoxin 1 [Silene latifolia]|uniref:putative nucleoredoxin 1 n=1 Tax=Silene latifolia TaxID=37657 RepID=UPI003D778D3A